MECYFFPFCFMTIYPETLPYLQGYIISLLCVVDVLHARHSDEKAVTQMLEDVNLDEVFADKETRMKFLTKAVSDLSERLAINHKLQCQNDGQQRQ